MNIQRLLLGIILSIIATPEVYGMNLKGKGATAPLKNKQLPKELVGKCIHNRCTIQDVRTYLDNGGKVNAYSGAEKQTLLHFAAINGNFGLAEFLLNRGANVEARDIYKETPLLVAVMTQDDRLNSKFTTIKLLIDRDADVNAQTLQGRTIDNIVAEWTEKAELERKKPDYSSSWYYRRCDQAEKDGKAAQAYIKVFPKIKKEKAQEALNRVVGMQADPIQATLSNFICNPIEKENQEFELLKAVIIYTKRIKTNPSTFKAAVLCRKEQITQILHAHPALFEKEDETGYTPMKFAEFLCAPHAIEAINDFRMQQAEQAQKSENERIKALNAKREKLRKGLSGEFYCELDLIDKDTVNARYAHNKTALMIAAENGHHDDNVGSRIGTLFARGANPISLDDNYNSAFCHAAINGHATVLERLTHTIIMRPKIASILSTQLKKSYDFAAQWADQENYKRIKDLLEPYVKTEPIAQTAATK